MGMSFPQPISGEPVVIVPYDPSWPQRFAEERESIAAALGSTALDIQHVGSTAVPGLAAKPIIDIMVGVATLHVTPEEVKALADIGYEHRGDVNPGSVFFRKGAPRSFHLHWTVMDGPFWTSHLRFRDCLRADSRVAREYETLKRGLAERSRHDRVHYTEGKTEFIQATLLRYHDRRIGA
jgi:GrpB-like predicted nucleotidyltransferase (UPF0157 family)